MHPPLVQELLKTVEQLRRRNEELEQKATKLSQALAPHGSPTFRIQAGAPAGAFSGGSEGGVHGHSVGGTGAGTSRRQWLPGLCEQTNEVGSVGIRGPQTPNTRSHRGSIAGVFADPARGPGRGSDHDFF